MIVSLKPLPYCAEHVTEKSQIRLDRIAMPKLNSLFQLTIKFLKEE